MTGWTPCETQPTADDEQGERTPMPGEAEQAKPPNVPRRKTCPRVKVCHKMLLQFVVGVGTMFCVCVMSFVIIVLVLVCAHIVD